MLWNKIEGFDDYVVSPEGEIMNIVTRQRLKPSQNQAGVAYVSLRRDHRQYTKAVALLVAKAYLPEPEFDAFDTPINLNGDRMDNRVENLEWRPRWFAVRYQRQFRTSVRLWKDTPLIEEGTGEVHRSGWAAALKNGVLYADVMHSAMHQTRVWPTGQIFRFAE